MKQFPKVTTIRDRFLGSRFQRVDNDDDDTWGGNVGVSLGKIIGHSNFPLRLYLFVTDPSSQTYIFNTLIFQKCQLRRERVTLSDGNFRQ